MDRGIFEVIRDGKQVLYDKLTDSNFLLINSFENPTVHFVILAEIYLNPFHFT